MKWKKRRTRKEKETETRREREKEWIENEYVADAAIKGPRAKPGVPTTDAADADADAAALSPFVTRHPHTFSAIGAARRRRRDAACRFSWLVAPSCGRRMIRTARRFVDAHMCACACTYVYMCAISARSAQRHTRHQRHMTCVSPPPPPPTTVTRVPFCSFACSLLRFFASPSNKFILSKVNSFHNRVKFLSLFFMYIFLNL